MWAYPLVGVGRAHDLISQKGSRMNIVESVKTAVSSVLSNKLRAFLTMLGIIIGISSVITIVSLGAGMGDFMEQQFTEMGLGNLEVSRANWAETFTDADLLRPSDVSMLSQINGVREVGARRNSHGFDIRLMEAGDTNTANLNGVTPSIASLSGVRMLYGRYINYSDIENEAMFAVINDTTAEKIFGFYGPELIGQFIEMPSWDGFGVLRFTIVGIAANPHADMERNFPEWVTEEVVVPISVMYRMYGTDAIDTIIVAANDRNELTQLGEDIVAALDASRGTSGNYNVFNPATFMEQAEAQLQIVTLVISGIAGISLLVGGIGVMNIMMVTVTERTREIGIRKSIGARNKDILVQFLIESIILTFIGGAIGILLGVGAGELVGPLVNIDPVVNFTAVAVAVTVSCATGIVFGVGPASRASRLDPIEALRYE